MMTHPAQFGRLSPQIQLVCLVLAVWLVATIPAEIVYVPGISSGVIWAQGGIACVLLGINLPGRLLALMRA